MTPLSCYTERALRYILPPRQLPPIKPESLIIAVGSWALQSPPKQAWTTSMDSLQHIRKTYSTHTRSTAQGFQQILKMSYVECGSKTSHGRRAN
ncbi:hypothetical protein FRB97_001350, partial [Tulasnella sp. 331]